MKKTNKNKVEFEIATPWTLHTVLFNSEYFERRRKYSFNSNSWQFIVKKFEKIHYPLKHFSKNKWWDDFW